MAGNSLIVPFLDGDPKFAHGVEVGILFERMKHEDCVEGFFLIDNQEQITLMMNRLGWRVEEMSVSDDVSGWFLARFEKGG